MQTHLSNSGHVTFVIEQLSDLAIETRGNLFEYQSLRSHGLTHDCHFDRRFVGRDLTYRIELLNVVSWLDQPRDNLTFSYTCCWSIPSCTSFLAMFKPSPISASRYGFTTCLQAEQRNPRRDQALKAIGIEQDASTGYGVLIKDDV